jgi:pimeloyl-ACP methyl ester carboxylesterase
VPKKMETKAQSQNNSGCLFCPNHDFGWHYLDVGQGRPLILLHGIGMSHVAWKKVVPNLAKERRVLVFDIAGFGSTPPLTDIKQTPANLVASLAETLSRIDADRQISEKYKCVDIVGNSLGGYMALEAAKLGKLASFRINSIVALSPAGLWRKRFPFRSEIVLQLTRLGVRILPRLTQALLRRERTRKLIMAIPVSPEVSEEDAIELVTIFNSAPMFASKAALKEFRESMKAPFTGGGTISRSTRVTIAFGERDLLLPPSARLRHQIPEDENVIWREAQEGWSHVPMWDDPEGVTKFILDGTA